MHIFRTYQSGFKSKFSTDLFISQRNYFNGTLGTISVSVNSHTLKSFNASSLPHQVSPSYLYQLGKF